MPIQKFSQHDKQKNITIRNKSTIRIVNSVFSKGFERSADLELDISFPHLPACYSLPFSLPGTLRKKNGLYFYQGNGAVFAIPKGSGELIFKVRELKSFDFEFVLSYDFYPGGI
jgi:hypothetical protein